MTHITAGGGCVIQSRAAAVGLRGEASAHRAKKIAAAEEICRELTSLETVTVPFGETNRVLELARV